MVPEKPIEFVSNSQSKEFEIIKKGSKFPEISKDKIEFYKVKENYQIAFLKKLG